MTNQIFLCLPFMTSVLVIVAVSWMWLCSGYPRRINGLGMPSDTIFLMEVMWRLRRAIMGWLQYGIMILY
ncbi:hypothetical protein BGC31_05930 [Komagataeibacter xylinus]|nr:hypothetical protein BGC31_05930 [Komagataeibacter xylinus]RFP00278.1 hypothetical protein BFX83_01645 [Komagataeibacter xylinus]